MIPTSTSAPSLWYRESRAIVHLAAPLALTQLAYMAITTTDVVMMGWLGPEALAAGALASHFYWLFVLFSMGLLAGATPIFAQHLGARRLRMIRPTLRHGVWLAALLVLPCGAVVWQAGTILVALGQDPEGAFGLAVALLAVAAVFHVADALQIAARGVLQGLKDTRVPMLFTLATSWGLGLPAAALLGIGVDLGGEGVWTGIAAAMIGACVLLIRRFRAQARRLAARASAGDA